MPSSTWSVHWYPLYLDLDGLLPSNSVLKTNRQAWKWSQNLLSGPNFHTLKLHSARPHHSPSPPECWEPSASGFQNTSWTGPCFRQDECIVNFRRIIRGLTADSELFLHDIHCSAAASPDRRAYYQCGLSPPSEGLSLSPSDASHLRLASFTASSSLLILSRGGHYFMNLECNCLLRTMKWFNDK